MLSLFIILSAVFLAHRKNIPLLVCRQRSTENMLEHSCSRDLQILSLTACFIEFHPGNCRTRKMGKKIVSKNKTKWLLIEKTNFWTIGLCSDYSEGDDWFQWLYWLEHLHEIRAIGSKSSKISCCCCCCCC